MTDQKPAPSKATVRMMIALIVMLLIGIITRWEYVKKELGESVERIFPSEQVDSLPSNKIINP